MRKTQLLSGILLLSGFFALHTLTETGEYTDYYSQEETQSQVITTPTKGNTLTSATSVPSTVYAEGMYEVGTEIPAGEYMLLDSSYEEAGRYEISTVREPLEAQIIDFANFFYNAIIHVSEGQYLNLSGCTASPISEVPQLDYRQGEMYKVGLQIPEGTYRLEANTDDFFFIYADIRSEPSNNEEDIIRYVLDSEEGGATVIVKNGEYLRLVNCIVAEEVSSNDSFGASALQLV